MLNPFVSCGVFATEMLIFYIVFCRIADLRMSVGKTLLIGFLLSQVASGGNLLFDNIPVVNMFFTYAARIAFVLLCFELRPLQGVFYAFVFEFINIALELMVISGIAAFLKVEASAYNSNYALLLIIIAISKTLMLVVDLALSSVVHPSRDSVKIPVNLFFSPMSAVVCISVLAYGLTLDDCSPAVQLAVSISCIFVFISSVFQVISFQHQMDTQREQLHMKSEYERLKTEKSYYDILEQQNQQLMMYAHDAKNHLAAIQALKPDQNISGYAEKLSDQLDNYTRNCHSGNMLLDVMVNKYVMECKRLGIEFEYNVKLGNLKELSELDLVAVLGNLMDNAVTAAGQSSEKKISLETSRRNSYAVLVIRNSCDTAPREKGGHLLTSKKEPSHHGFGLKSAMKTLKNYQGDLHWNYDESRHVFTMTAMIWSPLDEKVVYS